LTKFRILLSQTAVSQLSLLSPKQKKRIKESLMKLEENPFSKRSGLDIKKLITPDDPPLFFFFFGNYRAIYFVLKNQVRVTEIIHRSKGYEWLG